ncbi:Stf0 family sulfotransferase [Actibacterium sp. MT2.3-13A]|uniref:Stf0 family sulfotransferase n=1 Tax=Actibacterium sp. MT2.3-13A TaxID=2828332 RepID=UPI001BA6FD5C|nr:Stf0 family sulfotransferase [Actibacterium sp. MT2.3-13A]
MSSPFIIWTMRRTGGTTLTGLLMGLSERPKVEHEPFNRDRAFGWVPEQWRETHDRQALGIAMSRALRNRPLIKHCYELAAAPINSALLEAACRESYCHIVLDRRAEVDRILSLELAKITGAWGPKQAAERYSRFESGEAQAASINIAAALKHMAKCQQNRKNLDTLFKRAGVTPYVVYFEDLYSNPDSGRAEVGKLLDFIGLDPAAIPDYEQRLTNALLHKGQNSARMMECIPNIDEARSRLQEAFEHYDFRF